MPRVCIVDQTVSGGGVDRFLEGLVQSLVSLPESRDWQFDLLVAPRTSGGRAVDWPSKIASPRLGVRYLPLPATLGWPGRVVDSAAGLGVPGLARLSRRARRRLQIRVERVALQGHPDLAGWIEDHCNRGGYDVVYFSYPYLMRCPALHAPMVCTPHDFNFKRFDTLGPANIRRIEQEMPEWLARCRVIVVSSRFIADEVKRYYHEFSPKVRVVRLGVPEAGTVPTEEQAAEACRRLGLPGDFVLTAGWIAPHKNQGVLLRAAGLAKQGGHRLPVVFVGPNSSTLNPACADSGGSFMESLLEIARDMDLDYGTDFLGLGYVDDFTLECLYRRARMLVMPTLYEAGSFPVLEAARLGCPVVCSSIPPLVEANDELEGGLWLFDPEDPSELRSVMSRVLSAGSETEERAERARTLLASTRSWPEAARGYLLAFSEAVRGGD